MQKRDFKTDFYRKYLLFEAEKINDKINQTKILKK